ncbi:TonB-dependent receptor family protein [Terrimonas sp. NA20]|uniref:TonB-dependent receptor family protein n=1 Tax=Terrimonas ginsenosidimutans TaxID=2908004 RepID=A0ABS9KT81_9BACT|nr:outer membrane beta-barrel family protein [Terrimonas ginsenosidimutans]MCG2615495.1 TonB-dependent receptor family protein [Terrimonas ginsenosidimutans]
MRHFILSLLLLSGSAAFSQQINGRVQDQQNAPAGAATISLLRAKDSAVIKMEITKEEGGYQFGGIATGQYLVKATLAGHTPAFSEKFTLDSTGSVTLPLLVIKKSVTEMKAVTVTATKPLVEVKADKTIVNVEGTINATGSDMLELLRKSPGVLVDKDDNISMAGKNGVQIYIDGRPSPLSGTDLANFLKSLQSSQVESIQLITNPSAKYEAAGNAGIINIVLKKNKAFGTNGSVAAGWNIGTFPKYNGSVSLNHRNAKVNIFGNAGVNRIKMISTLNSYRTIPDSIFDQRGTQLNRVTSYNLKVGADYFIDKQTTIGAIITGNFADMEMNANNTTIIAGKQTGNTSRLLVAGGDNIRNNDNLNANLNFTRNGSKGKTLTINADYGFHELKGNQFQPNTYFDPTGQTIISRNAVTMITPAKIDIYSVKADYEQSIGKAKIEAGGKVGYVNTDNDFQQYNENLIKDLDRSNHFIYKENINAAYVNYSRPFKGFMIQAGLRAENTNIEGRSNAFRNEGSGYKAYDSSFKRNYTDLFPSAAVTFNKNPMNQLSITYSRRIDRPSYQQMNLFEIRLSEYYSMRGNIDLRPQYTNSFGITHTYKYKLTTSLNYSIVKDMFTQVTDTADISKSFITQRNLASQKVLNLNLSYMIRKGNYSAMLNAAGNYSDYKADIDGRRVSQDAFGFSAFMQNSLSFSKTWTAELTGYYVAPTLVMGMVKIKGFGSADLGIQKKLWNGKANIKASVSDVFRTLQYRISTDFSGQQTRNNVRFESRMFKLNFTYRFGSSSVKAARQRNTGADDENKRASQSGGSAGSGF